MFAVVIPLLVAIVIAVVGLVLRLGLGAFGAVWTACALLRVLFWCLVSIVRGIRALYFRVRA
ncbi:hypothetical protein O159_18250 [Leifsonia xyli subsp. cynodontis DSM 46306]|jgi:hypothetical protein|uniref:Uncharacterized protein n=1 Tax=Leifsonia xyli subsp. cynodontis DSM 46306 TaxID=1389489 RepID=U3PE61_LEIXC|nr:hypothetical protein [Leifsonia xyli]AGW41853.1 hypothetical protein O159_18250 [Leifsonia xyli subsp. cynodontis DSM 46306]